MGGEIVQLVNTLGWSPWGTNPVIAITFSCAAIHFLAVKLPNVTNLPTHTCLCGLPCPRGQYRLVHASPWNCKSLKWPFNAYNYIHTGSAITVTLTE